MLTGHERIARRESAKLRKASHKRKAAKLTPKEADSKMVQAILECARQGRAVGIPDFVSAGVSPGHAAARFKVCLSRAEEIEPRIRHMLGAEQ